MCRDGKIDSGEGESTSLFGSMGGIYTSAHEGGVGVGENGEKCRSTISDEFY